MILIDILKTPLLYMVILFMEIFGADDINCAKT